MAVSNTGLPRLGGLGSFLFGAGTNQSYEDLQRRRKRTEDMAARIMGKSPKTALEGIGSMLQGAALGIDNWRTDKALGEMDDQRSELRDRLYASITGLPYSPPAGGYGGSSGGASASNLPSPGAAEEIAASSPAADVSQNGSTFNPFINSVKAGGLTNPNGLAAVAATGRAESGWSPDNASRTWSDPSESGQPGTSGGILSLRGPRLAALQAYARSKGETGNGSAETQGEFFLQEDPQLIAKLNTAQSPEDAQRLMNDAWKFAGYNRPGGEAARRMGYANGYVSQFQGEGGQQVASLDPSAGMSGAAAIEQQAPGSGYVDPQVSAQPQQPAFDAGRFADPIRLSEMPASRSDLPGGLQSQASAYAAQPNQSQSLRPFQPGERRDNPDGSYSTELSTTWQLPDGTWTNVPSLWMGQNGPQQFEPNDEQGILGAMQRYEQQSGQSFPRFSSQQEAETSARNRSAAGGANAMPQNPAQRVTGALPPLPSTEVAPSPFVASLPPQEASQQGVQVAQNGQGYFPPAPASPSAAPPSLDPGWFQLYNDPGATAQDRAMAGIMIQRHMDASDPSKRLDLEYRQAQIDEARAKAQRAAAGGEQEYFGSTIPYYDQDGNLRYRQLGKNGVGKDLDFGPGASAAPPSRTIDTGTELITIGPGGQEISRTRKDVSGAAEQGTYGKELGAAKAALPQVESAANELLASIDSLAKDPYLPSMVGPWDSRMPNLSGDANRVKSKMDQIGGQSFMQAFNALRGAGQITEQEGAKATAAMGRLNTAQNEKDYQDALDELRGVVQRAVDTARRKAAGGGEAPAMPAPGNNRGQTTGGVGWSIEN